MGMPMFVHVCVHVCAQIRRGVRKRMCVRTRLCVCTCTGPVHESSTWGYLGSAFRLLEANISAEMPFS